MFFVVVVDERSMLRYIRDKTAAPYFSNLVWFIGGHVLELNDCVQHDTEYVTVYHSVIIVVNCILYIVINGHWFEWSHNDLFTVVWKIFYTLKNFWKAALSVIMGQLGDYCFKYSTHIGRSKISHANIFQRFVCIRMKEIKFQVASTYLCVTTRWECLLTSFVYQFG